MTRAYDLAGVRVLITRAADQAEELAARVSQQGGQPILLPLLGIEYLHAPPAVAAFHAHLNRLSEMHWAIFVSTNAVKAVVAGLQALRQPFPQSVKVAVVGPKTAAECRRSNIAVQVRPQTDFSSEALLAALPRRDWPRQQVMLFSAARGRTLLQDQLRARGADVSVVHCYQRLHLQPAFAALDLTRPAAVDVVIISSAAVLQSLGDLLATQAPAKQFISTTTALAYSRRIQQRCIRADCFAKVVVSSAPTDDAALQMLKGMASEQ